VLGRSSSPRPFLPLRRARRRSGWLTTMGTVVSRCPSTVWSTGWETATTSRSPH